MDRRTAKSWISLSKPLKYSILATVLGAIGLLTVTQWTAYAIREHIRISSLFVFPATLDSQQASTAFERMNREYSNAVVLQDKSALTHAEREASTVISSLKSADIYMDFHRERNQQILSLLLRIVELQNRSRIDYGSATEVNAPPPQLQEMASLARENLEIRQALEKLQSDLALDFRYELSLINKLLVIRGFLELVLLGGLIVVLFFSSHSLVKATVQRREEEILRQSLLEQQNERNLLRALIDNIPDAIFVKDTCGRFIVANLRLAQIFNVETPDEIVGKTDYEFFPEEIAKFHLEEEEKLIHSGQVKYDVEEKIHNPAGDIVYAVTTKVVLHDSFGQVTGLAGIGHDITSRKKSEEALREAELKYRGIFDKAIVGIFQSTPEGRFLAVNPAMAFTLGYLSPDEMIDSITDITTQFFVDHKRGVEFMLVMDRVGGVKNFECQAFQKDGGKIWLTMSIRAIRQDGMIVRYEGMCEDITERIMLREQLLQAQKLESVGQLAAGIAHEINTPTQYIGDNVRFLKDAFQDLSKLLAHYGRMLSAAKNNTLSPQAIQEVEAAVGETDSAYLLDEIPKAVDQTLEGVNRVATLVSAMKEFSHPSTKEKVPIDLNRAISSTITVARNEWKYVADLETDFDLSIPPVSCLPGEFNQVILNLIVNAAHAIADVIEKGGPEKGKIRVQTRNCVDWVEIRIEDSGTGIPEKVRSRIFDPFFTTKEIGKGTGQGLAIARSVVVDKHGGSIRFETEEGKGTTFIICISYDGKRLPSVGKTPMAKVVEA
jgi:PAS domain S-box-containing protein